MSRQIGPTENDPSRALAKLDKKLELLSTWEKALRNALEEASGYRRTITKLKRDIALLKRNTPEVR